MSQQYTIDAKLDLSILRYGVWIKPERQMPSSVSFDKVQSAKEYFKKLQELRLYLDEFVVNNGWIDLEEVHLWGNLRQSFIEESEHTSKKAALYRVAFYELHDRLLRSILLRKGYSEWRDAEKRRRMQDYRDYAREEQQASGSGV